MSTLVLNFMKKLLFILVNSFFLVFLLSFDPQGNAKLKNIFKGRTTDTIKREIPLDPKGRPYLSYVFTKQKASQLNLEPIELGYDSLQLRIWFDYSLAKSRHLIIIRRKDGKWDCRLYKMLVEWSPRQDSQIVVNKTIKKIVPKMGLDKFMKRLFALDITSLPNGPSGGMDGTSYEIEVATKDQYRFYEYWSPDTTEQKFWGSKNMVEIIDLLEKECGFKRLQK